MYKTMDLFAGAGGLSYGFEMTNKFQIVAAIEKNKNARETYKNNHKKKDKIKIIEDVIGCNFAELDKEEDKLAAEEEYKDKLDERYMALAKKFNVEPRKLLSHVLEYRIVV